MKTSKVVVQILLVCCFCVSAQATITLSDSVAWYKLDYAASGDLASAGEVVDSQANPNNGTNLFGVPSWVSTGVPGDGMALKFEGGTESIGLVSADTKMTFTNDLTLFGRVKVSGTGGYILNRTKAGGYAGKSWYLYRSGLSFTMSVYKTTGAERYATATLGSEYQDTWVNVFGVFNPGNSVSIFLYDMDGNEIKTAVSTSDIPTEFGFTERHMSIGGRYFSDYYTPGDGYNGEIESAAVWNSVLGTGDMAAVAVIPEPATLMLLGLGAVSLFRRK